MVQNDKKTKRYHAVVLLIIVALAACKSKGAQEAIRRPSFKAAIGTQYTEVRREFDNGISFSEYGFQQEPEWILQFLSEDSVKIYSPFEKKFLHYPVYFDHDSVFNMAREWVRLKHVNQDSLVFQLLQVEDKAVSKERSNVYMRFYSEPYLKKISADPKILQKPNKKDTLYIKSLIAKANRNPDNPDSAFSARTPAVFKSTTPAITLKRSHGAADPLNPSPADAYLNPEYSIFIEGAYKDFNHSFTVLVDQNGKIHLGSFNIDEEFRESRTRVLKGIIDVYLHKYLEVTPGSTLGMQHTSEVMIYLKGRK
ncbi:hypothetical protein [Desertivirga xinjiangensis]|uniref:hypothetical protein n=1 Tax=Desertivirga xinjiangensis TaxID=539206 RepID=UPI00210E7ED5|nr:hypothetical protein [Pedobacter xinjiangensis]